MTTVTEDHPLVREITERLDRVEEKLARLEAAVAAWEERQEAAADA